jgi:hypothetical protein
MVHLDGHVEADQTYYSVPPEYFGRRVWARWKARLVRIFNTRMEQIALHVRQEPGRFSIGPLPRGTETALAVEDDPSLRHLACEVLEANGYEELSGFKWQGCTTCGV